MPQARQEIRISAKNTLISIPFSNIYSQGLLALVWATFIAPDALFEKKYNLKFMICNLEGAPKSRPQYLADYSSTVQVNFVIFCTSVERLY